MQDWPQPSLRTRRTSWSSMSLTPSAEGGLLAGTTLLPTLPRPKGLTATLLISSYRTSTSASTPWPAVSISLSQCFESNARLVFASHGVVSPGPWLPSPVTLLVPGLCIVLVIILSSSLCRFLCLAQRYCLDYVFSLPLVGSVQPAYISVTKRLVTCLVHQEALLLTVSRSMWCARDTALANCAMLRPGTHGWSHIQFLTVTTEHKHANRLQRSSDCGASPRL